MRIDQTSTQPDLSHRHSATGPIRPTVVSYCAHGHNPRSHESVTRMKIAERLAALKRCGFGGAYDSDTAYGGGIYYVPSRTVVGAATAEALGIRSEADLFGGVVPYAFVGTKTITHPLVDESAQSPHGWSRAFPEAVRDAVLDGYAAFCVDDALRAGARLLAEGPARVKPALALGGRGQTVVDSIAALEAAVRLIDRGELAECGVVLEQNLTQVETFSVGQVKVDDLVASYFGTQSLAVDPRGNHVYGGSSLVVARGDFDALLDIGIPDALRRAVEHARVYDDAAHECFPGLFASRRNYDVVQGRDSRGALRCGVLEQSWRVGGASGAEIAALECFRANARTRAVRAWCTEIYGESETPPPAATVYFRGVDEGVGYITKYTMVEPYAHA